MPQTKNISVQNNLIKGLITESTGLTFPENACTDTDNCVFDRTGAVYRRFGFDYENSRTDVTQHVKDHVVATFVWNNVAGEGDKTFLVTQFGDELLFFEVLEDQSLSSSKHATTINLNTFQSTDAKQANIYLNECQFASGNGDLFVTHPFLDSFYVSYDLDTDELTATEITITVRDLKGVDDGLDDEERPKATYASLTPLHQYNLLNQGWTKKKLQRWESDYTGKVMPSNSDRMWYFKDENDKLSFTIDDVNGTMEINSPAARGHFKYSIYNFNRNSQVQEVDSVTIDLNRLSTCAFFAGRVFYSGLQSEGESSKIYFSQIIESKDQYGDCFQINDPTSEELFGLLPSDGGSINLLEAGVIYKMIPVQNQLIVFCSNGVWAITGSQGIGFTAIDWTAHKISSIQTMSHRSFVEVEGLPYWWNMFGIYTVTVDPQSNALRIASVSDPTIKSFFEEIPYTNTLYARGAYSPVDKRIQWIYRNDEIDSFDKRYQFNKILNYNIDTQAFFPWSVSDDDVSIHGIMTIIGFGGNVEEEEVLDDDKVVKDDEETVIIYRAVGPGLEALFKYLVSHNQNQVTFAENNESNERDWFTYDDEGVRYDSFFKTGYTLHGQGINRFQPNYINVVCDSEVDSSYRIRAIWNYSTSAKTGKWSIPQVFHIEAGQYDYRPNRIKIRGNGRVCQFEIRNNGDDPFKVVGWSAFESVNRWV